MTRRRRAGSRRGVLLAALCWLGAGAGPLGAAGVGDGLAAYRAGDYAAAAEVFGAAAEQRPEEPALLYNAGISAYQDGDYAAARASLQQAVNYAARPELAAAGHLALGNTRMMEAERLLQQQPAATGAALQTLEGASASFERALRVAPGHPAAARNLELARMKLDRLRRQPPPPQQQQQQQQQESGGQEQPPPGQPEDAPAAANSADDDDTGEGAGAPPSAPGAADEQQPPPAGAGQEGDTAPPEQSPEQLARQIIAAEEANAARRRERQSRLQPVPRDW